MKKILIFISTAILSVSLLFITAFASRYTVPFNDVLQLGYVSVYQLSTDDYERYRDDENLTIGVTASDGYSGSKNYQAFYVTLYYNGPDILPYQTIQFIVNFNMTGDLPEPFTFSSVFIRDDSKSQWDFVGQERVGDIFINTDSSVYLCSASVSYTNTTKETIVGGNGASGLTFVLGFKSQDPVPFYEQIQVFEPNISDFYLGDLNSPEYPSYTDPSDDYGEDIQDYKDKEEAVLGEAEEGKEIFSNSISWLHDALNQVTRPLLAIGRAFDFIFGELLWLHYLVRFSLAIGLVAFVLNIGSILIRNVSRYKGGSD